MNNGFVVIHRRIKDSFEYLRSKNCRFFMLQLILKVNWKEEFWKGETVKRGETITSIKHLAIEFMMSEKEIRNCLSILKKSGFLDVKGANRFTHITLINYDKYQKINPRGANEGQTKGTVGANEGQQYNNNNKETIEPKDIVPSAPSNGDLEPKKPKTLTQQQLFVVAFYQRLGNGVQPPKSAFVNAADLMRRYASISTREPKLFDWAIKHYFKTPDFVDRKPCWWKTVSPTWNHFYKCFDGIVAYMTSDEKKGG